MLPDRPGNPRLDPLTQHVEQTTPTANTGHDRGCGSASQAQATGTDTTTPHADPQLLSQQLSQQFERDRERSRATGCEAEGSERADVHGHNLGSGARLCDKTRGDAIIRNTTAGVTQLVECQPSKLNVEGSSPFARFEDHFG